MVLEVFVCEKHSRVRVLTRLLLSTLSLIRNNIAVVSETRARRHVKRIDKRVLSPAKMKRSAVYVEFYNGFALSTR